MLRKTSRTLHGERFYLMWGTRSCVGSFAPPPSVSSFFKCDVAYEKKTEGKDIKNGNKNYKQNFELIYLTYTASPINCHSKYFIVKGIPAVPLNGDLPKETFSRGTQACDPRPSHAGSPWVSQSFPSCIKLLKRLRCIFRLRRGLNLREIVSVIVYYFSPV